MSHEPANSPKVSVKKKTLFHRVGRRRRRGADPGGMGKTQTPYQCPHCDNWHLTTVRKSPPMERAR